MKRSTLADEAERRVRSRKELAREQRRAAYQRAKERRATDPRHLALLAASKERRRAAYEQVKEHRKAVAAAEKAKRGRALWKLVTVIAPGSPANG